jgi:hypothetical protein
MRIKKNNRKKKQQPNRTLRFIIVVVFVALVYGIVIGTLSRMIQHPEAQIYGIIYINWSTMVSWTIGFIFLSTMLKWLLKTYTK